MKLRKLAIFALIGLISLFGWFISFNAIGANSSPVVSNVKAQQRPGTKLVDITYDVDDPDGDILTVTVEISDDGGNTFKIPAKTFTGDVGSGIKPARSAVGHKRFTGHYGNDGNFMDISDDIIFSERRV